jgi:hypothetical protein
LRQVRVAIEDGYLADLEERKGRPARLTPGDPLPGERAVLPHPDMLAGERSEHFEGVRPVIRQGVGTLPHDLLYLISAARSSGRWSIPPASRTTIDLIVTFISGRMWG